MYQIDKTSVHLWRIALDQPAGRIQEYSRFLSDEELFRAGKFVKSLHRDRYISGHGAIRCLLAEYLGCSPDGIKFEIGEYGKPHIGGVNPNDLEFNYSHSQDLGVLAVTMGSPVGVDVEYIRPINDAVRLAERFFTRAEVEVLRSVPENFFLKTFFTIWTCKEAYIKAIGRGLTYSLNNFDIFFNRELYPGIAIVHNVSDSKLNWSLRYFIPENGYISAISTKKLMFLMQSPYFTNI
jgi:4'-phosphopantetheinyl transferase